MNMDRSDLGEATDFEAVRRLVDVAGLRLVDVGCGAALTSREFVALGAEVLGVEPDPVQAEKNRRAEPVAGLAFVEAGAERLALDSGSVDGVCFFRSLHHVPIEHMDAALREAVRVLKPESGFLCVVEPGMTGTHFEVMKPFHDETRVRTAAQAALARTAGRMFRDVARHRYVQFPRYADFEALVTRFTGQTFSSIGRQSVETDEVRARFERGRSAAGDYVFEQPMLLDLHRGPLPR